MNNLNYAGDKTPAEAWEMLEANPNAQLIDVRSLPEWQFVGLPDLSSLGRKPLTIDWQIYPEMAVRENFAAQVEATGVQKNEPVLLLCRSGVRSRFAADALTTAGFEQAFNILEGFEGDLDEQRHRGANSTGWKGRGLPWTQ